MALDVTVGGAASDSYASLTEADAFNAGRMNAEAWTAASDAEKEGALRMATLLLDAMPAAWTGASATGQQALRWPRIGMTGRTGFAVLSTVLPAALQQATAEFARQLLETDRLGDNDVINQHIRDIKAGSVSISFGEISKEERAGSILPDNRSAELAGKYLVPDVVRVMLVPSWLLPTAEQLQAANKAGLIFEAL
jgi:hypothetical protein